MEELSKRFGGHLAVLQGVPVKGVQVLRWKRLIFIHAKRVRRTVKSEVKLHPPLCRPLKHSLIHMDFRENSHGPITWCLIFREDLCEPMALKVRQKSPPRLALAHGWLFRFAYAPSLCGRTQRTCDCLGPRSSEMPKRRESSIPKLQRETKARRSNYMINIRTKPPDNKIISWQIWEAKLR